MTLPIRHPCIMCDGTGRDEFSGNVRAIPCGSCGGKGWKYVSRDVAFARNKEYLGTHHPKADHNGYEKWVRYCAEIPPELAALIDTAKRRAMGVNAAHASRAGSVRYGLRLLLDELDPEGPAPVDSTADPIVESIPITEVT